MRALQLQSSGPRVAELPFEPRPGESVVGVRLAGVCATDLELVKGYMGFTGVLGHEWVGTVLSSPNVSWVGRRVTGEINAACGACPTCRAGRPTHCPTRTVTGILGRDGAFAEQLSIPEANLRMVPDTVPDEAAVFVEPLAAACQILEQVHIRPSDRVIVIGAGRLGQLCARVLAGVADVTVLGRSARGLGRVPAGIGRTTAETAAPGADVVVDCSGSPEGLALATRLVRPRGTVVLKTTTHDLGAASPTAWVIDEVTVVGSRCGPFGPALRLLANGQVDPRDLIDARFRLEQGVEALQLAAEPGVVKVLIEPG